jgi:6-phosphogluconolactonase
MKLVEYPDKELMMFSLADVLASDLGMALRAADTASLCVPGGTTPGPVFDVLSAVSLDWHRVTVFLNDERWVPETSDRSNGRLVKNRLLVGKAAAARYVPLYMPGKTPDEAADDISAAIEPHLPISVLLVGMGADMHTASLFPGADQLVQALAADAPVVMPVTAAGAVEPRMTLTARVLADAMAIHVLITGAEKRAALERARALPPEEAPIRALLANATVHWAA